MKNLLLIRLITASLSIGSVCSTGYIDAHVQKTLMQKIYDHPYLVGMGTLAAVVAARLIYQKYKKYHLPILSQKSALNNNPLLAEIVAANQNQEEDNDQDNHEEGILHYKLSLSEWREARSTISDETNKHIANHRIKTMTQLEKIRNNIVDIARNLESSSPHLAQTVISFTNKSLEAFKQSDFSDAAMYMGATCQLLHGQLDTSSAKARELLSAASNAFEITNKIPDLSNFKTFPRSKEFMPQSLVVFLEAIKKGLENLLRQNREPRHNEDSANDFKQDNIEARGDHSLHHYDDKNSKKTSKNIFQKRQKKRRKKSTTARRYLANDQHNVQSPQSSSPEGIAIGMHSPFGPVVVDKNPDSESDEPEVGPLAASLSNVPSQDSDSASKRHNDNHMRCCEKESCTKGPQKTKAILPSNTNSSVIWCHDCAKQRILECISCFNGNNSIRGYLSDDFIKREDLIGSVGNNEQKKYTVKIGDDVITMVRHISNSGKLFYRRANEEQILFDGNREYDNEEIANVLKTECSVALTSLGIATTDKNETIMKMLEENQLLKQCAVCGEICYGKGGTNHAIEKQCSNGHVLCCGCQGGQREVLTSGFTIKDPAQWDHRQVATHDRCPLCRQDTSAKGPERTRNSRINETEGPQLHSLSWWKQDGQQ